MAVSFNLFLSVAPTLPELTRHVDVGRKWYLLGILLKINARRLDSIQGNDDVEKTLRMFNLWLETSPTASRESLLEALRLEQLGEHRVADEYERYLREDYETWLQDISYSASQLIQRVETLTRKLKQKDEKIRDLTMENTALLKVEKKESKIQELEKKLEKMNTMEMELRQSHENLQELNRLSLQLEDSLAQKERELELHKMHVSKLNEQVLVACETVKQLLEERQGLETPGKVDGKEKWVRLASPSSQQCWQVLSEVNCDQQTVILMNSSPDIAKFFTLSLMVKSTIKRLEIVSTILSFGFIHSFVPRISNLQELVLTRDSIKDEMVFMLAQFLSSGCNTSLTHLDLSYNPDITCASAQQLASMLLSNTVIKFLYLSGTAIKCKGSQELMDSLLKNKTLRSLRLDKSCQEACCSYIHYQFIKHKLSFAS